MASTTIRLVTFSAGAAMVLAGCDPSTADRPLGERLGGLFQGAEKPEQTEQPAVGNGVVYTGEPRDVEAPEIFEIADQALWDGRPSLGGIWVAHPDVKEPQRVIMRNTATGKSVVGALFKRERENPGPVFQLSSDAATALGVLAGTPVSLKVTALRKEEAAAPALPLPEGPDAVDAGTEPAEQITPDDSKSEPVAAPVVASAATAATAAPAAIESSSIDTIAAAEAALAKSDAIVSGETVARPVPAQRPQTAASSDLAKPYLQVGIFSKKVNADATAGRLSGAGLQPNVLEQESRGQTIWRVIVGPAQTRADRTALLRQIRDLGFKDAYAVTN